ncbi:dimeric dihydrodiol dehydrogenase [Ilyonectria destructans]|nr:dimeric dihydrodiol dehydrogenase [Ilyonectria destructans]
MSTTSTSLPTLRWGIIGAGTSATWLVRDLLLPRPSAQAQHIVQAIGSDSKKGNEFAEKLGLPSTTKIYNSHAEVYADPNVDIVHIAVPHSFHLKECLQAFDAGKHVLCEKPFAVNAKEGRIIFEAAKKAKVWVGEGMWTRALPITQKLLSVLHEEKAIGRILRVVSDCGFQVNLQDLPQNNRYRALELGAGSLLDLGIYLVNWALLATDPSTMNMTQESDQGEGGNLPRIVALQGKEDMEEGNRIEVHTGMLMQFGHSGPHAVLSSTTLTTREQGAFCRVDGTNGHIDIEGPAPPMPTGFTVFRNKPKGGDLSHEKEEETKETYTCESPGGMGFYWEADQAALDIAAGRMQSSMMPWSQTMRVMRMMDGIRKQGGVEYPQDD